MNIYDKIRERSIYAIVDHEDREHHTQEIETSHEVETKTPLAQEDVPWKTIDHKKEDRSNLATILHKDSIEREVPIKDLNEWRENIKEEVLIMLQYALHTGIKIPDEVGVLLSDTTISNYIKAHGIICDLLAPSTPQTILYISKYYKQGSKYIFFSKIPLIRNFMIVAIISFMSLIISGLSPEVNRTQLSKGILENDGATLLHNLIFLSSASLIGASFFLLSKLIKEVKEATLSAHDYSYYWIMLIMGVISGMILSEGITINKMTIGDSIEVNRLLFAILGGFSSEIVYRVLQSIMLKLQSVIAAF